jgi:hypothetical protein
MKYLPSPKNTIAWISRSTENKFAAMSEAQPSLGGVYESNAELRRNLRRRSTAPLELIVALRARLHTPRPHSSLSFKSQN